MNDKLHFKVSSGLKRILGKELITDSNIAIFELVKNSFDAGATEVLIKFLDNAIEIHDNGKGMSLNEIKDKWLFVAYSAKKEGVEDKIDYRDKIAQGRNYAGAKGIGRFSCDRLGDHLKLITKPERDDKATCLSIDWHLFEEEPEEHFTDIELEYNEAPQLPSGYSSGTTLVISELWDNWSRDMKVKLKKSLAKLILPDDKELGLQNFTITIESKSDLEQDQLYDGQDVDPNLKVNGNVENFIFEKLSLKTTVIESKLIEVDGVKTINISLFDRGQFIYDADFENIDYTSLHNVATLRIFFLNRPAKTSFARYMGINTVNYGSIFVYKNGFRVAPYGESGEDFMGIDRRKAQQAGSHLGSREIIGRIELVDSQSLFVEASSRDAGFIYSDAYSQLQAFFIYTLRKLEKYVIEFRKWGIADLTDVDLHSDSSIRDAIINFVSKIGSDSKLLRFKCDQNLLSKLDDVSQTSITGLIDTFEKVGHKTNDASTVKQAKQLKKHVKELQQSRNEYKRTGETLKEELDSTTSENLFLRAVSNSDNVEILSLQHHVGISTGQISKALKELKSIDLTNTENSKRAQKLIEIISLENTKIKTVSNYVTKAKFKSSAAKIHSDIVSFISEYVQNVFSNLPHIQDKNNLNIRVSGNRPLYKRTFRPLEIVIVLDNLINNSIKSRASEIIVSFHTEGGKLLISIADNGIGIKESSIGKIFEFGYTTTDGSGLGLFHVEKIIDKLGGKVYLNNQYTDGAEFIIEL